MGLTAYRRWHVWRGTLEARADIKNLLNKQYEIVARYPMPGQAAILNKLQILRK